MKIREFEFEKDYENIFKIWREIGWINDEKRKREALKYFVKAGQGKVIELNNEVEGYVNSTPGYYQYLDQQFDLQAVSAVTISRVARKQGIGTKATAQSIAEAAAKGTHISALGMFEQGFYNKLGYGTGSYEHFISFDPDHLKIPGKAPVPERIKVEDYKKVHEAKLERKKRHGYCTLLPPEITRAEMFFGQKEPFGLGYKDKEGNITHHIWVLPNKELHGPYFIRWMTFNTIEQFFDLMNLIKNLGDQVHLVKIFEPAGIQFQDLINKPIKDTTVTKKSDYQVINKAMAYWQIRLLDLKSCINNTSIKGETVEFNLKLKDPIEKYLDKNFFWQGLSGEYTIRFGENSNIKKGLKANLPVLKTDINTFTRMWIGAVRPALLPYTNYFEAPQELINKLDNLFVTLPTPKIDWDF
ncbi:MAG TPA: GNAT family N-acetyltransferase [Halanaerobiales bacterium]|nr:GNAT family N-acetyltransferase [Halanaerobiales bacterium]